VGRAESVNEPDERRPELEIVSSGLRMIPRRCPPTGED